MYILVTGAAGFIGFHVAKRFIELGFPVFGIDNINDYYDQKLKQDRLAELQHSRLFSFSKIDISNAQAVDTLFSHNRFTHVIHLAAQAGVRYSLSNPRAYVQSNLVGFINILEGCRHTQIKHLIYASSSSVYGLNAKMPYETSDNVDHPISLYAATKKSNELMAHSYSYIYNLPTTGLRFFTVYGPWGRPDMAMHIFTKAILEGTPIPLYNGGDLQRDFTYINDITEGVVRITHKAPRADSTWDPLNPKPETSPAPYAIYNIGNNFSVELKEMIRLLEKHLGKTAEIEYLPMQPGDVQATYASIDPLIRDIDFRPATPLEVGISNFTAWYKSYYG